ncbi:MAG: histidine kinase dimerization/phosphoacceptor domain -containing protein [Spirochaetia bacterium]|nr:histidine kinase dimerization/phosphoacceptor domain -containing protein [Spirochaetia bacterium]
MMSRKFVLFIVAVIIVALSGWVIINNWHYSRVKEEVRLGIKNKTLPYAQSFCSPLKERFALLEGLYSFAHTLNEDEIRTHFGSYAKDIYTIKNGIRNLSIAPEGIQKYVYPHTRNEVVEGHNLLQDSREEVRKDIQKTIESGEIEISGPYELRQGGEGIIARKAVFEDDTFWGLVTIVIDMPHIYEESGLDKTANLLIALKDSEDRIVWGESSVFRENPIIIPISIAHESWSVAAIPLGGWSKAYRDEYLLFSLITLFIAILVVISIVLFARKFSSVSERSKQQQERYENLFNSIRDVIVVTDSERTIVDINQRALKRMFGYDPSELTGESTEILYESFNYYEKAGNELLHTKDLNNTTALELSFRKKDGRVFSAELTALNLYDKRKNVVGYVGIIRDVSERKVHEKTIRENTLSKELLNELAAKYLSRQGYEPIIHEAIEQLHSLFPQYRAAYSTIDIDGNLAVKYSVQPENMPDLTGLEADVKPAKEYLYSLQTNRVTRIGNVEDDSKIQPLKGAMKEGNTHAVLDVSIPLRDEIRGLLCFDSSAPTAWSDHEIHILEEYANFLTLIMDNDAYQKKIEESNIRLQGAVKEKQTLLTEVHHRVKNILNVIVSLLKLQEDEVDSVEKAIEAFQASQKRIYSMALVHESLYKSDKLSEIDLDQYIQTLAGQLKYSIEGYTDIEYHFDLDPVSVDIIQWIFRL